MGPSAVNNGEPAMDTNDWRTQLPSGSRQRIVNKIMETMNKHCPSSGPEGMNELRRIASRFEDKIFNVAVNQTDYLRKLSLKMLTLDTKPLSDWRAQIPSGSRQKIVNKIMETVNKHYPFSGPEGMNELRRIASRFEEKIFSGAVNQTDYLRKISMKMMTMENKPQNATGPSSSSLSLPIPGGYSSLPLNPVAGLVKAEPVVNTGDWRTCLPLDSRKKNASKIKGTLEKHVPNCGKEGNKELKRIADSIEELIFNTAVDQVDYLHKTSFKITP